MTAMPNFGYHLARLKGTALRRTYRACLPFLVRRPVQPLRALPFQVFSCSGENDLPEQVASIRSFLRWAGRPKSFTVVSDGSYSPRSVRLLESIDDCVSVCEMDKPAADLPDKLRDYLQSSYQGKQLALIMSLPLETPALYLDSDVRFFPGAAELAEQAAAGGASARYLADCQFSGDARLLHDAGEKMDPVNMGVLLLFEKPDWSNSIARFLALPGAPDFFTNQTMTHLTMHRHGARPFDPTKYVLQLDDQFLFSDLYAGASLALRHYVRPVRHKFWTSLKY
jgi:hypothetical protein